MAANPLPWFFAVSVTEIAEPATAAEGTVRTVTMRSGFALPTVTVTVGAFVEEQPAASVTVSV